MSPAAKRTTLRDRENQARASTTPAEPTPAAGGFIRLGTYWQVPTFADAKSAYLVDLDQLPDCPNSFARWIDRAVDIHAALTPERRANLVQRLGPETKKGGGVSRSFVLAADTVEALETAIVLDRTSQVRVTSRTEFVADAVRVAIAEAKVRYGSDELPVAPARLPNKPVRATR
jgi:hypothetical protein